MGCDIHLHIQYRPKEWPIDYFCSFGGEFNLKRDYTMFGALAGVRSDEFEYIEPRGLPENINYSILTRYCHIIIDDEKYEHIVNCGFGTEFNYISKTIADTWVSNYKCKMFGSHSISIPDYHSASWLTPDEFENVIEKVNTKKDVSLEYLTILSIVRTLENNGKNEVQLVFWFDN